MSTYQRKTIHPETGQLENATWHDDYFGRHKYGVQFEGESVVFKADEYEWKFEKEKMMKKPRKDQQFIKKIKNK